MRVGLIRSVELEMFDDLPKVTMPTLALGIRNDTIHPIEQAKQIAEKVQKGKYHEVMDKEAIDSQETAMVITDFFEK